jgi:citrate lyase subunit beta/citryl-CoA lyase
MRSWLLVPGHRLGQFTKTAADELVLDLKNAVAPEHKEAARDHVVRWLDGGGQAWVRVNAPDSRWHRDDLTALRDSPGLRGVVVPRVQGQATVRRVEQLLPDAPILAVVETAVGVQDALAAAACVAVSGLVFDSTGFTLDIGSDGTDESLAFARGALVVAARAAGLPPPLADITGSRNADVVHVASTRARRLGFGGMLFNDPAHLAAINHAFDHEPAGVRGLLVAQP